MFSPQAYPFGSSTHFHYYLTPRVETRPGWTTQAVYGEKLISVEAPPSEDGTTSKIEYRVWNPFRSKLAAAILGGVDGIHIVPGAKVRTGFYVETPLYRYFSSSYYFLVVEVA